MDKFLRIRSIIRAGLLLAAAVLAGCASHPRGAGGRDIRVSTQGSCGQSYTVRRGDSLSRIGQRCDVNWRGIAQENGIRAPWTLHPGQRLRMPGPSTYTVRRGDNMYRIARAHNLSTRDLARLNGMSSNSTIHPGQELRVRGQAEPQRRASPPPARRTAQRPTTPPPATRYPSTRPPARIETQDPQLGTGAPSFQWPVQGQVLETFGAQSSGGSNDGIKIAVQPGDPVRAAAPGSVVYAGDELQGYGNLVLVRHSGGYVTAYAHNSVLRVAEGAQVSQGDIIAQAGQTGSANRPQLHFEIRRNVTPIDPMGLLPRR